MAYVRQTLGNLDVPIVEQLLCVSRVHKISLALGQEATQNQLIPFLTDLCSGSINQEQQRPSDEVLTCLAETFGGMEEFVGTHQAHSLFKPLTLLCKVDETTVRQQAVHSINKLSAALSPEQVAEHLGGEVIKLIGYEWFTGRVSGVGLVAQTYEKVAQAKLKSIGITRANGEAATLSSEEMAGELASGFVACCADTVEPMVRRTAATQLRVVAAAVGAAAVRDELAQKYVNLIAENEQESIRVNALKSSPAIFTNASLSEEDPVGKAFLNCVVDKSWRVRVAVAEALAEVANAIKDHGDKGKWEGDRQTAQRTFEKLLKDPEVEVRLATAAQSAAATTVLSVEWAHQTILPDVKGMLLDENSASTTRVTLAGTLIECAMPLGVEAAKSFFLDAAGDDEPPLLKYLLEQSETNLRLEVIKKLAGFIDVFEGDPAQASVVELIHELCADKNWRVRHAAMCLFPALAARMSVEEFRKQTRENAGFHACITDNCALIRLDYVRVCKEIADSYQGRGMEGLVAEFVDKLESCSQNAHHNHYQQRAVLLDGAAEFMGLDTPLVTQKLIPKAKEMLQEHKLPNLRMLAAKSFARVFEGGHRTFEGADEIKEILRTMATTEEDIDCKAEAENALKACGE